MSAETRTATPSSYALRRVARGARRVRAGLGLQLRPRPLGLRLLAAGLGMFYLVVAFFALGIFSVPSGFHGWFPTALGYLPGLLLLLLGTGLGRPPAAVGWAVAVALGLGSWGHYAAAPVHERIEQVAVEVGTPEGWTRTEKDWSGSTWGLWNDWPEITYVYTTTDPTDVAGSEFTASLAEDGWERDTDYNRGALSYPDTLHQRWERGRWNVVVSIDGPDADEVRRFDSTAPEGLTRVRLVFDGQR